MPVTVWKGQISFGLVSFPVRLHSAARAESVQFHMLHKTDRSRVKSILFCAEENKRIERSDVVKGYEIAKDQYVVVEDEELKKIAPASASTMEILQFVDSGEVDPIYLENSYYVAPEEKTSKPYVLFLAVLSATKQDAIAKVAMHNREHIVLLRPSEDGLILHTLYYPAELQTENKGEKPVAKFTAKELELARSLVKHLKAPFDPSEFQDSYRENVMRLISQKQKGRKISLVPQPRSAPVIDLMDALKRSLKEGGRGKVAPNTTPAKKAVGRGRAA